MKSIRSILAVLLLFSPQWSFRTFAQKLEASSNNVPPAPANGIYDPDGILTKLQEESLAARLQDLDISVKIEGEPIEVQMSVVVVDRIDMKAYPPNVEEHIAAELLARTLHDTWGIGHPTQVGGTGVLIFVSLFDRVVYISRGGALDRVLNNGRIDDIINAMRPAMRQAKFAEGLLLAVDEVAFYIEKGEPTWKESFFGLFQIQNLFLLGWVGAVINGLNSARKERQERMAYAEAASQLSEIDRAQAEALQGRYEATSCPVCLESFKSSTVGSDDQPIKLLRCGHVFDESCWSEWVSSGQGNITKCPICKMDIGQSPSDPVARAPSPASPESPASHNVLTATDHHHHDHDQVVLRRFQQERNFRLMRLGMRYPNFITQSQIQQWSSPTYNGSLARDPVFRQRSPQEQLARRNQLHRSSMGSSRPISFGGGRSSGGGGGRF